MPEIVCVCCETLIDIAANPGWDYISSSQTNNARKIAVANIRKKISLGEMELHISSAQELCVFLIIQEKCSKKKGFDDGHISVETVDIFNKVLNLDRKTKTHGNSDVLKSAVDTSLSLFSHRELYEAETDLDKTLPLAYAFKLKADKLIVRDSSLFQRLINYSNNGFQEIYNKIVNLESFANQ